MRVLWITSKLLPEACRAMGYSEAVVGGWMHSQLNALLQRFGAQHDYFVLASDARPCDVQVGNVHYRSFGRGEVTYGNRVPREVEDEAQSAIQAFKPDVIHAHGTEFFYGRMGERVYCNVPVVVSLQGVLQGYAPFVAGALSSSEVGFSWLDLHRQIRGISIFGVQDTWRTVRVAQEDRVFKAHRHFMGRTDWDRAWLQALNPEAAYYPVNETLRPEFYGAARRDRASIRAHSIYCSAAAGYPLKGLHFLLRAIAFLKDKYPDITVRVCSAERLSSKLTFMGMLKMGQYVGYLRRLIRHLGIERHVVGLPSLSADDVAQELSKAEVFVLPSLCENSPNSLGEAQLIGVPAIATFVGGVPSVLRDNVDGRLVPSGDPATLAAMIDWFFEHPDEADAFAQTAMEQAEVRHDPVRNAEATMRVYETVAAEASCRGGAK